ncbi:hypothetical protein Clacol_008341 [Clathrus columnatus]|uniref:Lactam utilization protein LamB n=1 Tax=Clathrus columnatus TaxID=1419009 RepID=A0AAV5AHI0_9AGAM|nr:hypothetical protein Clacol_008341 [Clathrus columnatus]
MVLPRLKATVNCDMGEADDEALMKTIHLANVACGFHASDFSVMNKTVLLAKESGVKVGAHPSLPDKQGFGRREMAIEPVKPHGAVYGQMARSLPLSRAGVAVAKIFREQDNEDIAFVGLAGTEHQRAAEEEGVRFIPEWFADLDYSPEGRLLITKIHTMVSSETVKERVERLLTKHEITCNDGTYLPIGKGVTEVSICCHSDTPGAVEVATLVKTLVDESNSIAGYTYVLEFKDDLLISFFDGM